MLVIFFMTNSRSSSEERSNRLVSAIATFNMVSGCTGNDITPHDRSFSSCWCSFLS